MIVTFEETYLKDLFVYGRCSDKKHRYPPQIIKRYQKRIETLQSVDNTEALYQLNSLNFEVLKGDKKGLCSVRVNDQYRVEFSVSVSEEQSVMTICNIVELSNHYK